MASQQNTVDFILEQMRGAGAVSARRMFGEYALFCEGKLVGLICDDQLFLKPTRAGRLHIGEPVEAPPYPRAKPSFLISGELWEDAAWLSALVRVALPELPVPKPKRPAVKNGSSRRGRA